VTKCRADGSIIETIQFDVTWVWVRHKRNAALTATDWTAVKDRTMSQAWKDYRTALRDLPQDYDSANDAADNWPVMPDA
jgi:phosphoribosylcarboxyaminoimidazole (NCAIR) mutase